MGRYYGVKLKVKELKYAVVKDAFIRVSLKTFKVLVESMKFHNEQQYQNSFHSGSGFAVTYKR